MPLVAPAMSPLPSAQQLLRNVKSPFRKVIATHYYDGPTEGFLEHRDWEEACVFQLLDWDRETDLRVYEIARILNTSFDDIVGELFLDKLPTWPVWVLPSATRSRAERLVDDSFRRAQSVAIITTADLFDDIALWDAGGEAASSGIIARLRRRPSDAD